MLRYATPAFHVKQNRFVIDCAILMTAKLLIIDYSGVAEPDLSEAQSITKSIGSASVSVCIHYRRIRIQFQPFLTKAYPDPDPESNAGSGSHSKPKVGIVFQG
jgi:hypothetical protein